MLDEERFKLSIVEQVASGRDLMTFQYLAPQSPVIHESRVINLQFAREPF